ncbi:MAG: hypothetical protein V4532_11005 [Pseudomonadota bacterium]
MIARATFRTPQPIAFSADNAMPHPTGAPAWAALKKPHSTLRPVALTPAMVTTHRCASLAPSPATSTTSSTASPLGPRAKYFGHGALSVRSSVTGRHYRFNGHGDTLVIDRRDHLMLLRIPDLQIV